MTGTLRDPSGPPWQIQNGTLTGNQLTFDVTAPQHGHTKNIHFMGDVGDDAITFRNESQGKQGRTLTSQPENRVEAGHKLIPGAGNDSEAAPRVHDHNERT